MRYLRRGGFLCGLLSLGLLAQATWANPQKIRLASWNVYNLFDDIDDPYSDKVLTRQQMEDKLKNLSHGLRLIDADVIGLQEVEKAALAQRLAQLSGYRYAILVEGNDTQRGIDVALLSKVKVKGYRSHKNDPLPYVEGAPRGGRFSRDCLEVHLETALPMVVLVNHFKSKVGKSKSSDSKRRAQALRVGQIVTDLEKRHPGLGIAVVGDLNDTIESWALEPLARSQLWDAFSGLSPELRYTHKHKKEKLAIDHILLNPVLKTRMVPGSASVGRDKHFAKHSDHAPVQVDLQL